MKRVVSFFTFVFLFVTLSNAFQTETLDQILDDHERLLEFKPSSDAEDPSKILLPTESSTVPDDTRFSPVIEEKEAVTELQTIPGTPERADTTNTLTNLDLHSFVLLNRLPVQMDKRFDRYSFPIFRYKYNPRHGCRQLHRFMRHPRRLIGENEVGFVQVLDMDLKDNEEVEANRHVTRNFPEVEGDDLRMVEFRGPHLMFPHHRPRHHHHHHHHHDDHDEDDQMAEMREVEDDQDHEHVESEKEEKQQHNEHEHEEKKQHKHKDDEHGNSKKYLLKKIRKFLGYF